MVGSGTSAFQNKAIPDCNGSDQALNYATSTNTFTCRTLSLGDSLPSGMFAFFNSATCPSGWTRVTQTGRFFRERAADTVLTTGGNDTGSDTSDGPNTTRDVDPGVNGTATVANDDHTHGVSHDNRPAFLNLTGCSKN